MNTLTISAALSFMAYDELKIIDNVRELFPKLKCHFKANKNGNLFYGIVTDDENGRFWLVTRGTDGFTKLGNFESWIRNLRLLTGGDGTHNGFEDAGNKIVDDLKHYFYNYDYGFVCGHSQGAGISQYTINLLTENFPKLKHVHGDVFAAPPTFDIIGKERFDKNVDTGRMSLDRYVVPGDPIDSDILRNPNAVIFNGTDVGNEVPFNGIIGYDLKLFNVVKHSCKVYLNELLLKYSIETNSMEDIYMLGRVWKKLIN